MRDRCGGAGGLSEGEVTRSAKRGLGGGIYASIALKELVGAQWGWGDVGEVCWGFQFQIIIVVPWIDGRSKGLEDGRGRERQWGGKEGEVKLRR